MMLLSIFFLFYFLLVLGSFIHALNSGFFKGVFTYLNISKNKKISRFEYVFYGIFPILIVVFYLSHVWRWKYYYNSDWEKWAKAENEWDKMYR